MQFVPQLTLLTAVAVAETIRKVTGCKAGIKWLNDIVINGKKVCGILAESIFSSGIPEKITFERTFATSTTSSMVFAYQL